MRSDQPRVPAIFNHGSNVGQAVTVRCFPALFEEPGEFILTHVF